MISLLAPSRGRPQSFRALLDSIEDTAMFPDQVQVIWRADSDDMTRRDYPVRRNVLMFVAPRRTLSSLWNDAAGVATGDILMQCADDIRFRSAGWDERVRLAFDEYPDKIAYVYGRDGIADQRMATHGFMHRRWYETLGYFTWPEFSSDYGDLWNHTIAEKLGRLHFLPEVYTEHLHPAVGKAKMDQTHRERIARDENDDNAGRWEDAQPYLELAVEQLRGVIALDGSRQEQLPTDR